VNFPFKKSGLLSGDKCGEFWMAYLPEMEQKQ